MENIRVRLGFQEFTAASPMDLDADPTGGIQPSDNAAFGAQPQGYGWLFDWQQSSMPPQNACSVAVSWPGAALARIGSRNRGYIAS
jgi:hypothetical protein